MVKDWLFRGGQGPYLGGGRKVLTFFRNKLKFLKFKHGTLAKNLLAIAFPRRIALLTFCHRKMCRYNPYVWWIKKETGYEATLCIVPLVYLDFGVANFFRKQSKASHTSNRKHP